MSTTPPTWHTQLLQIVSDLSAVEPERIGLEDRLREDLGFDSVSAMELISMLAEELEIEVELEEAMSVHDVQGVFALAERHLHDR